jgi:hypothetical protein
MLFRLLRNVVNWASNVGHGVADAEDRFVKSMFEEDIDRESNED